MTEVLIRPDLGKKAYRLKARFTTNPHPSERTLELAKVEVAEKFVRDMKTQGWDYLPAHGFAMRGPFPKTEVVVLPSRSQQERWHTASAEMLPHIDKPNYARRAEMDGGFARTVPTLAATEAWEFELQGVFTHDTILTESPDRHEEQEELRNR